MSKGKKTLFGAALGVMLSVLPIHARKKDDTAEFDKYKTKASSGFNGINTSDLRKKRAGANAVTVTGSNIIKHQKDQKKIQEDIDTINTITKVLQGATKEEINDDVKELKFEDKITSVTNEVVSYFELFQKGQISEKTEKNLKAKVDKLELEYNSNVKKELLKKSKKKQIDQFDQVFVQFDEIFSLFNKKGKN